MVQSTLVMGIISLSKKTILKRPRILCHIYYGHKAKKKPSCQKKLRIGAELTQQSLKLLGKDSTRRAMGSRKRL